MVISSGREPSSPGISGICAFDCRAPPQLVADVISVVVVEPVDIIDTVIFPIVVDPCSRRVRVRKREIDWEKNGLKR